MSTKKLYDRKKRNEYKRRRKRIVLLSVEGGNRTERNYFKGLKPAGACVHFAKGNDTDPVNMTESLIRDYRNKGLNQKMGDAAFCIVDGDLSREKETQITEADILIKKINGRVIVSNPCVEVWFLCHYTSSTRQYVSSDEAIKRLRDEFISEYEKGMKGVANLLSDKLTVAMTNAKRLDEHNADVGRRVHRADYQPATEIPLVISCLIDMKV